MCVKLPPEDMNSGPYPLHLTNTYICEVTIKSRVCCGDHFIYNLFGLK